MKNTEEQELAHLLLFSFFLIPPNEVHLWRTIFGDRASEKWVTGACLNVAKAVFSLTVQYHGLPIML